MKVFVEKDYESMSERAFSLFLKFLPETKVLGLATGNSPLGFYRRICRAHEEGRVSLKGLHTFNLDEYYGIKQSHPESYRTFMNENLFGKVDISDENIHFPASEGEAHSVTAHYNEQLDEMGGPDFQLLGIGQNGHIAFNEPGSPKNSRTRVVRLTQSTIEVNKPPSEYAVTMGLLDILKSKRIVLLASGKSKADAVSKMIDGPMTYKVPASYLQEHPEAYIILDRDAASKVDISSIGERVKESEKFGDGSYFFDL